MPTEENNRPLTVTKFDSLGPYGNNAYLIADRDAGEALIVDMPAGSRAVLDALAQTGDRLRVTAIALTHTHPDHWADYDLVKKATGAPVLCNPAEVIMPADRIDGPLSDGDEIPVGGGIVRAIHTPGHTPGSTCYLIERTEPGRRGPAAGGKPPACLLSGDVLFPGGPGATRTPEDLRRSIDSITRKLYALPDDALVFPGHGADTTIGESKREYAVFASNEHPSDLCGDVKWIG